MGADICPPLCFTNPFSYVPHPMCIEASKAVRTEVLSHSEWLSELQRGKMFGVLVVENSEELGYLAAFSGQLNGESIVEGFVPPIFDTNGSAFFQNEMHEIEQKANNKEERHVRSLALQEWLFKQYICYNGNGEHRSVMDIFVDYYRRKMLKQENYSKNASSHHIPSGTGECCGPKLLQYAYLNGMHPLCMAEFWIQYHSDEGNYRQMSIKPSEVRHDGRFYPACGGKCRPLLDFMLRGLNIEQNQEENIDTELLERVRTIYEDDYVIVVDKPGGLLSVPGRNGRKSIADWLYEVKHIENFWFVHRLDQDTRGLLVIAKDEATYKNLQQQFIRHEVDKTYDAWVEGNVEGESGKIVLRMRADLSDPPRQIVDIQHGKKSVTRWRVIERKDGRSHLELYPDTGRTHQLRVHCAHAMGLNAPIVGDRLYGNSSSNEELHLTAKRLRIRILGIQMTFEI